MSEYSNRWSLSICEKELEGRKQTKLEREWAKGQPSKWPYYRLGKRNCLMYDDMCPMTLTHVMFVYMMLWWRDFIWYYDDVVWYDSMMCYDDTMMSWR